MIREGVLLKCGVWPSPATAKNLQPTIPGQFQRFPGLAAAAPGDGRTPARRFADFENTPKDGDTPSLPIHSWTRINVLMTRLPAAIDLNSSGNCVSGHSPSTKSAARITPVSMKANACRIVRGV